MPKENALTTKQKIAVMAILVPALITVLGFVVTSSNGIVQTTNGGDAFVHKGNGDINTGDTSIHQEINNNYGMTDKQQKKYEQLLKDQGIAESAVNNLFALLGQQNVPLNEWDHELRRLAERQKALKEQAALLDSDDPKTKALLTQAREAINNAQYEKAEKLLTDAVEQDNAAAEKIKESYLKRKRSAAESQALKAETLHTRFSFTEAINAYQFATQLAEEGEYEERIGQYKNSIGRVFHDSGKYHKAIEFFELALASGLKNYGENHPSVAIRRNNLGAAWKQLGEYRKAIEFYKLALTSDLKTFGENHPKVAICRNNLGAAQDALKN